MLNLKLEIMKLKSLLLMAALFVTIGMNAQEKALQFGVKAGANLSNFNGDVDDNKAKVGFNVGVTVDYALTSNLYLLSGLEFTTKGAKSQHTEVYVDEYENISFTNVKETVNLTYLELPVHIGYKLLVGQNTRIIFHGGPYIAYGLGGKYKTKYSAIYDDEKEDSFGKNALKRLDFGLGAGAGVEFGQINVGLGYDFGLTNIARKYYDSDDQLINNKVRNMNGYLTVGYKF